MTREYKDGIGWVAQLPPGKGKPRTPGKHTLTESLPVKHDPTWSPPDECARGNFIRSMAFDSITTRSLRTACFDEFPWPKPMRDARWIGWDQLEERTSEGHWMRQLPDGLDSFFLPVCVANDIRYSPQIVIRATAINWRFRNADAAPVTIAVTDQTGLADAFADAKQETFGLKGTTGAPSPAKEGAEVSYSEQTTKTNTATVTEGGTIAATSSHVKAIAFECDVVWSAHVILRFAPEVSGFEKAISPTMELIANQENTAEKTLIAVSHAIVRFPESLCEKRG